MSAESAAAAVVRLAQYEETSHRFDCGAERAMYQIACELRGEVERMRAYVHEQAVGLKDLAALVSSWHKRAKTAEAEVARLTAERDTLQADFDKAIEGFNASAMEIFQLRDRVTELEQSTRTRPCGRAMIHPDHEWASADEGAKWCPGETAGGVR